MRYAQRCLVEFLPEQLPDGAKANKRKERLRIIVGKENGRLESKQADEPKLNSTENDQDKRREIDAPHVRGTSVYASIRLPLVTVSVVAPATSAIVTLPLAARQRHPLAP